jgi:hypothetical protein
VDFGQVVERDGAGFDLNLVEDGEILGEEVRGK